MTENDKILTADTEENNQQTEITSDLQQTQTTQSKLQKAKALLNKIVLNKWVALVSFFVGLIYITVYGFLKFPDVKITASQLGLIYPVAFKFWGILSGTALTININYLYNKYDCKLKLGYICMLLGFLCIMTTVHIPSTEIMSLQLVAHWSTALLFGVFFAAAIIFFLFKYRKKSKAYVITLIAFACVLAAMIILLIIFGKSGIIESIPIWGTYVMLFFLNYTNIYKNTEKTNSEQ